MRRYARKAIAFGLVFMLLAGIIPTSVFAEAAAQPPFTVKELSETSQPPAASEPTEEPTAKPTAEPTDSPKPAATEEPTVKPTAEPTESPSPAPTEEPTAEPTAEPTDTPSPVPTEEPTAEPTDTPTPAPTEEPTALPTAEPTNSPDATPTEEPTPDPTTETTDGLEPSPTPADLLPIDVFGLMLKDASIPFEYTIDGGAVTITGYTGTGGDVEIPSTIEEYPVTTIGASAFSGGSSITGIRIPASVTSIGSNAFSGCSSITDVSIPPCVTKLSDTFASSYHEITKVTFVGNWTSIGAEAFYFCSSLTDINIPSSVTSIGSSAFLGCSTLTSIAIPSGVNSIGSSAFRQCSLLTSINLPSGLTSINSDTFWQCDSLASVDIPSGVTSIGARAFSYCNSLKSINIPSGITFIDSNAFYQCREITEVSIPPYVQRLDLTFSEASSKIAKVALVGNWTSIGNNNFYRCSALTDIGIPSTVTSIGDGAFAGCSSLASIDIPSTVISIGNAAFAGSALTSINIPSGVTSIGSSTFEECSALTSINIPSSVTSIGTHAFDGCSALIDISIPFGLTSIGVCTFCRCSALASINIPSSVTSIDPSAFEGCSALVSINIPSGVTSIGSSAFYGCSALTGISIPSGVTSIGSSAFYGCSALTSVDISATVTSIGTYAFGGCSQINEISIPPYITKLYTTFPSFTKITKVAFVGNWTSIDSNMFNGCSSLTSINIPSGVTRIGSYAFKGCSKLTDVIIPPGVTSIGEEAFFRCSMLTSINIPSEVTIIDQNAFSQCSALTSISIPSGVTSIGVGTFEGCSKLTSVILPSGVTSIGGAAFYECSSLTNINIPSGVTTIDIDTFHGCSALISIDFPSGVTSIESYAFYGCSSLTSINIPSGVTIVSSNAFEGCSKLRNVIIPSGVTSIGYAAFKECSALTSMDIPTTVTTIEIQAFRGCSALTSAIIPSSVTSIGDSAFDECSGITEVSIPPCVTRMYITFPNAYSKITKVALVGNWTSIGEYAFYDCRSMTSINIPPSVTFISDSAIGNWNYNLVINTTLGSAAADYALQKGIAVNYIDAVKVTGITLNRATASVMPTETVELIATVAPSDATFQNLAWASDDTSVATVSEAGVVTGVKAGSATITATATDGSGKSDTCIVTVKNPVVSFNSQGGTVVGNRTAVYGSTITAPTAPTRTGYTFTGWYTSATGGTKIDFATFIVTADVTLYAHWTINTYTMTFNSNGGSAVASKTAEYNTAITEPAAPARTGYTFAGWYTSATGGAKIDFATFKVTANTTLYAHWTINTYTVTFNSNGGSAVASKISDYNTSITAPTSPTRTGYTFAGWYTLATGGTKIDFATFKVTADVTLYAHWTINTYTVTFNSNGGSAVAPKTVNYNTAITEPTAPTKAGYIFAGWCADSALTTLYDFATLVTSSKTLYARWANPTYTVRFDSTGGSAVASKTVKYNTSVTAPTSPTRTGYTFEGWYTLATGGAKFDFATFKVTANITLYAHWTINTYTVTFNSNGGSAVASKTTVYNTTITAPTAPTRTGYTFVGWYTSAKDGTKIDFATFKVKANKTLYAYWTINTYRVSFDSNGGSAVASKTAKYNSLISAPKSPTRTGYTFTGWYTSSTDGTKIGFSAFRVTADSTLYAHWTINTYTVSFNSNGGSAVASIKAVYNTAITAPTAPTRTGYTFAGWFTSSTGGIMINFATFIVKSNITLYAHWTINTYTVSFDSNGGTAAASKTAKYNTTISAPKSPTRTGYKFTGWYTSAVGGTKIIFTTFKVKADTTLYAHWTINKYKVTFNSNGGSTVASKTANYNTAITAPTAPTRKGLVFVVPTIYLGIKRADHFQDDPRLLFHEIQHRLRSEHVHTQRAPADEMCVSFADQCLNRIPQAGLELDAARIVLVKPKGHLGGAVPRVRYKVLPRVK